MLSRAALSLVELSIVLVILGLLVGGILAGQSLIRASELRSISSDLMRYQGAVYAFRDKYMGWPGDITNATAFWGRNDTQCAAHTGSTGSPGTCNGNGNGRIQATAGPTFREQFYAWQQLSLAGLIEGNFTGDNGGAYVAGVNMPASRYPGGAFMFDYKSSTGDRITTNGNKLYFGAGYTGTGQPWEGLLSGEEMWNIDKKIDDGIAWSGKFWGVAGGSYRGSGVTKCTTPGYADVMAGAMNAGFDYLLNDPDKACHGNYLITGT